MTLKNTIEINPDNKQIRDAVSKMNAWGKSGTPFFFIFDYALKQPQVFTFDEAAKKKIFFEINGVKNFPKNNNLFFEKKFTDKIFFKKNPEAFEMYEKKIKKYFAV